MPFRCRQKFLTASISPAIEREEITLPTGDVEIQFNDLSEKTLPEPELFDLKNQLNAGIEPEEVASTVIKPSTINGEKLIRKYTKKSTKNEVNE